MWPSTVQKVSCAGINSLFAFPSPSMRIGVVGYPNLPVDENHPEGKRGCLFAAVKSHGTRQVSSSPLPLLSSRSDLTTAQLTLSAVGLRSTYPPLRRHPSPWIFRILAFIALYELLKPVARSKNGGGIYLRMPTGTGYGEKIWVSKTSGCFVVCC